MGIRTVLTSLLALTHLIPAATAYRVNLRDTDELREVCSGMYGGQNAYIELAFDDTSLGQLALVIYEWKDVQYLGAETPDTSVGSSDLPKTYICTTSAVRSGLCTSSDLGSFITTLPSGTTLNQTSIFTSGIRFDASSFPVGPIDTEEDAEEPTYQEISSVDENIAPGHGMTATGSANEPIETDYTEVDESWQENSGNSDSSQDDLDAEAASEEAAEELYNEILNGEDDGMRVRHHIRRQTKLPSLRLGHAAGQQRRQYEDEDVVAEEDISVTDEGYGESNEVENAENSDYGFDDSLSGMEGEEYGSETNEEHMSTTTSSSKSSPTQSKHKTYKPTLSNSVSDSTSVVPIYTAPIVYRVKKSGYYCIGVVPVTLVSSKKRNSAPALIERQSTTTHAEYSGSVLFRNNFEGELPAAEYPKIGFYGFLSLVYIILAGGWGFLCFKFRRELLPMQLYISGTICFLVVEMIANWAYYRYINKHGGSAGSLAFLFVVAILNAGRNSLSFFLLLIVSMGLSVVTQSLGPIMNRVRLLTAVHFVFGVLYSIGTVQVELESASIFLVLFLIFPLALTLTAFLMWTILSLNGTILHLSARKQRHKLQMFKRLYRILMIAVIAVAAFFVISSLSLSNRLDEDYAPNNWRYRWILLDASLAMLYLAVFVAFAWLWRPSRDSVRFAMSQELAQDEADADDYEIADLESSRPVHHDDNEEEGYGDESTGFIKGSNGHSHDVGVKAENVVFALEDEDSDGEGHVGKRRDEYRDMGEEESRKRD